MFPRNYWLKTKNSTFLVLEVVGYAKGGVFMFDQIILRRYISAPSLDKKLPRFKDKQNLSKEISWEKEGDKEVRQPFSGHSYTHIRPSIYRLNLFG